MQYNNRLIKYKVDEEGVEWPTNVLPYDYFRCSGSASCIMCSQCERNLPGNPLRQTYSCGRVDITLGTCSDFIGGE